MSIHAKIVALDAAGKLKRYVPHTRHPPKRRLYLADAAWKDLTDSQSAVNILVGAGYVEAALDQARARCAHLPQIRFARLQVPRDWPEGRFDLILLSEVVYYLGLADVDALAARVRASLEPGGRALLVHWLGPTNYPLSGDAATERFIASAALRPARQLRQTEYRLDLLLAPPPA